MSKTKPGWTPGEWFFDGDYIWGPDGELIGEVRGFGSNLPREANGAMLASGPKLYKALFELLSKVPAASSDRIVGQAYAALKEARGEKESGS